MLINATHLEVEQVVRERRHHTDAVCDGEQLNADLRRGELLRLPQARLQTSADAMEGVPNLVACRGPGLRTRRHSRSRGDGALHSARAPGRGLTYVPEGALEPLGGIFQRPQRELRKSSAHV